VCLHASRRPTWVQYFYSAEARANAGYSEIGAIPVATPVAMTDGTVYGLMPQQMEPISATLVPETKVGNGSSPPQYIVKQQKMLAQIVPASQQQRQGQPNQNQNFAKFTPVDGNPTLSRNPMMMRQCPSCGQESRTRVSTYPAWQTWTASVSYY
jgi:hypothetical protein